MDFRHAYLRIKEIDRQVSRFKKHIDDLKKQIKDMKNRIYIERTWDLIKDSNDLILYYEIEKRKIEKQIERALNKGRTK